MKKKNKSSAFAAFSLATSISFNLAASILVGLLGGRFIDGYLNTSPIATVIGIILGILSGLWVIYRKVTNFERLNE